jgi:ubiquinone/menaquinone biosynthesis C-methylase UbiE
MSEADSLASHSSAGHRLSNAAFVDAHYAVCQSSYEAMLRSVGIQQHWHVLDAGCGSGSFLPLLAELVGPDGKITAIDLDPKNVEQATSFAKELHLPVTTHQGTLTNLPYEDSSFDAIWSANVTQYLPDDALRGMLSELVRVTKPGGLVAIKESDATILQFYPLDAFVFLRFCERQSQGDLDARRILNLPQYLQAAGLLNVRQKTFLEEVRAPLPNHTHAFMAAALQFFAKEAESLGLPEADLEQWRRCHEPESRDNPVNHPDFYFREGCTLIVGTKAAAG